MPAKKATEPKKTVEKIEPTNPALEMVTVTVPLDRGNRVPYTTSIMVTGFGAKHYVIPRGVPVKVPAYVAQAIMEDVKQQLSMDARITRETQKFNEMIKAAFGG